MLVTGPAAAMGGARLCSTRSARRGLSPATVMWVVLGIPLASIVAGVGLVVVSVRSGSADAVMDKVDRTLSGVAEVTLKTDPDATGRYEVRAEVAGVSEWLAAHGFTPRGV